MSTNIKNIACTKKNTKKIKNHLKYMDESVILKKLWHDSDEA